MDFFVKVSWFYNLLLFWKYFSGLVPPMCSWSLNVHLVEWVISYSVNRLLATLEVFGANCWQKETSAKNPAAIPTSFFPSSITNFIMIGWGSGDSETQQMGFLNSQILMQLALNNPDGVGSKAHSQPVVRCLIHLMASHFFFRLRAWLAFVLGKFKSCLLHLLRKNRVTSHNSAKHTFWKSLPVAFLKLFRCQ